MLHSISNFFRQVVLRSRSLITNRTLGVAAAFSAKAAGAGLGFLTSILLARILGAGGTGIYFLALTIVGIGATIARLGLDNAVLRFASVAYDQDDKASLAALYRQSMGLVFIVGGAVALLIWLAVPHLPLGGEKAAELHAILPLMLFALVPSALIQVQGGFLKAIGKPGLATFVQSVALPMFLVTGMAVIWWQGNAVLQDIVLLYTAGAAASVLFGMFVWCRRQPGVWSRQGKFSTRFLLRTSLPLLWVASMSLVMSWTDILVLGLWADSATVGVYGVATRIASLTAFILIAVNSVTAPRFAILYSQDKLEALERLAQRSAGLMLLAALPVIFVLLLLPEQILQVFGTDFVHGAPILRILAFGQLVNVATGSVGYLLMMTGYERLMRNTIIFSAFLNLVGNLILVPLFGAVGAAVSTSFALTFMNLLSFLLVNKKLRINTMGYFRGIDSCGSR